MKRLAKPHLLVTRFPFEAQWGGEEVHTMELMRGLDQQGYEICFLGSCPVLLPAFRAANYSTKKAWLGRPPVSKAWLLWFSLLSPLLFLMAGWQLWRAKSLWKIDTVYMLSFGEKLLMTPWAQLFKMKVLWLEHARIGAWFTKNPWRLVYRWWSRWATVVVTSKAMRPLLTPHARRVVAIPCAVMDRTPAPLPKDIVDFLNSGFSVANVSRLTVDKGVDMMVRLVHSKPDMRLIFVGTGPLDKELEKACQSEQVMWVKSMPRGQLMSLYKQVDLFVLASREMDPFGMVAAEAMWHGAPTVVTNVCGIAMDLRDGQEAMIVPPRFSVLDKTVKKMMKHEKLREDLGRHGQQFAHDHYDFKTMLASFEKLLERPQ